MQCFKVSANSNAGGARQRGRGRCKWGRGRAVRSGTRPVRHGHTRTTTIWRCTYVRADQTRAEQRERKPSVPCASAVQSTHTHDTPATDAGRESGGPSCIALARVRMHGWGGWVWRAGMHGSRGNHATLPGFFSPPFVSVSSIAWAWPHGRRVGRDAINHASSLALHTLRPRARAIRCVALCCLPCSCSSTGCRPHRSLCFVHATSSVRTKHCML